METNTSLSEWLDRGWLVKHKSDRREIRELLGIANRAIADAEIKGISPDARLSLAHNATLQIAIAALAAMGYHAGREAYQYRAIQSLAFTIGANADLVAQLDEFRKKRNVSDYERAGSCIEDEAKENAHTSKNT